MLLVRRDGVPVLPDSVRRHGYRAGGRGGRQRRRTDAAATIERGLPGRPRPAEPEQSLRPPGPGGGGEHRSGGNFSGYGPWDIVQVGFPGQLSGDGGGGRANGDSHPASGALRAGGPGNGGAAVPAPGRDADPAERRSRGRGPGLSDGKPGGAGGGFPAGRRRMRRCYRGRSAAHVSDLGDIISRKIQE